MVFTFKNQYLQGVYDKTAKCYANEPEFLQTPSLHQTVFHVKQVQNFMETSDLMVFPAEGGEKLREHASEKEKIE